MGLRVSLSHWKWFVSETQPVQEVPMEAEDSTVETTGTQDHDTFVTDQVVAYGTPIVGVLLLFVIGLIVVKFFRGVEGISQGATEEELEFERQLSAMAGMDPLTISAPPPGELALASVATSLATAVSHDVPSSPPTGQPTAASSVDSIARRLTGLGIVTEMQGRIPLAIPPEGLIYGLKKGGACGILPRQEAAEVMEHLSRRFEILFYPAPSGEILSMERLQSRLPSLTERQS